MQAQVASPSRKAITVTEEDNNGEISLPYGGTLVVRLGSNPSTGYSWQVAQSEPSRLKQLGDVYERPGGELLGAAGRQVFRFKEVTAGRTELIPLYRSAAMRGVRAAKQYKVLVTIAAKE